MLKTKNRPVSHGGPINLRLQIILTALVPKKQVLPNVRPLLDKMQHRSPPIVTVTLLTATKELIQVERHSDEHHRDQLQLEC